MSEPLLSEIKIFAFNFPPRGWAQCNGQLLPINQNQAVFSLLGTTYGGDGRVNFALPDLRGRVPMQFGTAQSGSTFVLGQRAGEEVHPLSISEIPAHTHQAFASGDGPSAPSPLGNFWGSYTSFSPYNSTADTPMSNEAVGNTGIGQSHENRSPYLALNICIALQGLFPSRD